MAFLPFIGLAQDEEVAPKSINYQGRLADSQGQPFGGDEGGTFRLRFQAFDVPTGGVAVWAEEREVVVIKGIFNVTLGAAGADPVGEIPSEIEAIASSPESYLEVTVVSGPGVTTEQILLPRQQLQSVPFTFMAQNAQRSAVADVAESVIPELAKALNPPGTIIAYAGPVTDDGGLIEPVPGYLFCNGAVINDVQENGKYQKLKAALGTAWGDGSDADSTTVRVPDLRGVFLRGLSGLTTDGWTDPDKTSRVARWSGGNTGHAVGSFQMDEFKSHSHNSYPLNWSANGGALGYGDKASNPTAFPTSFSGGSETRGKNAYVAYLIKY